MAKHEADREDLMAEGANLRQRARVTSAGAREWVVGWRNEHSMSVFVGQDPVFHFNASGELRRAYVRGEKLAAADRQLTRLVRSSNAGGRLSLKREPLASSALQQLRDLMVESLGELNEALLDPRVKIEVIGISTQDFREKFDEWMTEHPGLHPIAKLPNVD